MTTLVDDARFSRPPALQNGWFFADDDDEEPAFGFSSRAGRQRNKLFSDRGRWVAEDSIEDEDKHGLHTAAGQPSFELGSADIKSQHTELYAILNLDTSAALEDVLRSYRALAIAFHPDKHRDPDVKQAAEATFARIQHAYEVLSDPQKRAVYDLLGEDGLNGDWQVGQKLKSASELRAEYEEQQLRRAQADIESLIRSRTEANISLVTPFDEMQSIQEFAEALASTTIRQLFLRSSTACALSASTVATYSASMMARRGQGGGNFSALLKHQYSDRVSIESGASLLRPRSITGKVSLTRSIDTVVTVETAVKSLSVPPPLSMTYGTRVWQNTTVYAKLATGTSYSILHFFRGVSAPFAGTPSNVAVGVSSRDWSADIATNQFLQGQASLNYTGFRIFGSRRTGWKLALSTSASSDGTVTLGMSTERKLTENTSIALGLGAVAGSGALTLRIRLSRLGQRLSIPILVSQAASPRLILSSIAIPGLSIACAQYFYLEPRRRKRIATRLRELREEVREETERRREAAMNAAVVLKEQSIRKRDQEVKTNGLVITSAFYMAVTSEPSDLHDYVSPLDVAYALQSLVTVQSPGHGNSGSVLIIPGGRSKCQLMGFYDILVGSRKQLVVEYLYRGLHHEATFTDTQPVALPMRSHLVE